MFDILMLVFIHKSFVSIRFKLIFYTITLYNDVQDGIKKLEEIHYNNMLYCAKHFLEGLYILVRWLNG